MPQPAFKNISYTSQGRLPVTAVGFGFDTILDVKNKAVSPHYLCLDGEWDFKFYSSLDVLPEGIELLKDFGKEKITVPSDWQTSYSKHNWMSDEFNPQSENAIALMDSINEVGVYHRTIDITTTMLERELYLQLNGVGSVAEVYLNGCYIGFCQSSYDGHRFCIAEFATLGENHLTIIVHRYSYASWIEDREGFRLSGIFRSVWLCGEPIFAIDDVVLTTELSRDDNGATLNVETDIRINAKREQIELWCILYDSNKVVVSRAQEIIFSVAPALQPVKIDLSIKMDNPLLWSDEVPNLYHVVLFLQDNLGNILDMRRTEFGFRQIESIDGVVNLNGNPLKLYGTRYEEWHPDYGRTLPPEQLLKDMHLIKRCNLNTIYLDQPASDSLYEICNRIGLYVISNVAANLEGIRRNTDDFIPFATERAQSMVKRLRCHPSVICWGVGRNSGKVAKQLIDIYESLDNSRLIEQLEYQTLNGGNIDTLTKACKRKLGQEKPIIAKGLADVQGNSLGGFTEYTELLRSNEQMLGGIIANFIITAAWNGHDFYIKNPEGVLQPDRTTNPTAFELKHCFSPIALSLDKDFVTITNLHHTKSLENHYIVWELRLDGLTRETDIIDFPTIKPGDSRVISIPYPLINTDKAVDLIVSICDNTRLEWSDPERVICSCHHKIKERIEKSNNNFLQLFEEQEVYSFNHADCRYVIDKQTGLLVSATENNFEFLTSPLRPQIARACREEEQINTLLRSVKKLLKIGFWQEAENSLSLKRLVAEPTMLLAEFVADGIRKMYISYRCNEDGELIVEFSVTTARAAQRLGITFDIVKQLSQLACFCLGPDENYCDRNNANLPVLLQGDREELCHHYLIPQENGNRTGAEWLMLYGKQQDKNPVMLIKALDRPVDISVHPYSKQSLLEAENLASLAISENLTVNIDAANGGVTTSSRSPYNPVPNKMHSMELSIKISRR